MAKNGYFQLISNDNGTFVRLFPQENGGVPIQLDELREYLSFVSFNPDPIMLKKAISNLTKPVDYKLDDKKSYSEMEVFKLTVSPDKMSAIARFYPPSNMGASLRKEDIVNDLKHKGIAAGIQENEISRFLSEHHYCSDYEIALGKKPVQGSDAFIEYFFNTDPNLKPALNEDGTVDFYNLNVISKCKAGQVLATLHPEVKGEPGYNVEGERLPAREVVRKRLRFGKNIKLTEDQLSIISEIDGHVSLIDDLVTVTNTYEVKDVDTTTGNIEYTGNVIVTGNVKAGFVVQADGNIEVRGVVEGALLDAGGDIIITRGMNGMGRGMLVAKGNVVAKFIENATVTAGGYVHSEAIMHSTINARGDVTCTGKRGFITGGSVHSLGTISARVIGSTMGANTEIEVGVDPTVKQRIQRLQQSIADAKKQILLIEPTLVAITKRIKSGDKLNMDQQMRFKQMTKIYQEIKPQLMEDEKELEQINSEFDSVQIDSMVMVSDFIYPGTTLKINDVTMNVNSVIQHSRFVRDGADISIKAL